MAIKAIIFDLDGTLVDSIYDIGTAVNGALDFFNLPPSPLESYSEMVGDGLLTVVKKAAPSSTSADIIQEILKKTFEFYEHCYDKQTKIYPSIDNLLNSLTEKQIKLAILSNKQDYFTKKITESVLRKWKFEPVLGSRENIPRKPDPYTLNQIISDLNIDKNNCLYVGDSGSDMKTAISAEVTPIGVSWGYRPVSDLIQNGASKIIDHPMDLLHYLS